MAAAGEMTRLWMVALMIGVRGEPNAWKVGWCSSGGRAPSGAIIFVQEEGKGWGHVTPLEGENLTSERTFSFLSLILKQPHQYTSSFPTLPPHLTRSMWWDCKPR